MIRKSLSDVVSAHPFPDYAKWWPMGERFLQLMSDAIIVEWSALPLSTQDLGPVQVYVQLYSEIVYRKSKPRPDLVVQFTDASWEQPLRSGEFDALSYAFYRSAFELIAADPKVTPHELVSERRQFTVRVGSRFFASLSAHLDLDLPESLETVKQFKRVRDNIRRVGSFLQDQGYLRDKFDFRYDVNLTLENETISQGVDTFLSALERGKAYALYEMGFPAILPSAVYLYQTFGEAQHHSSRTIEELFARVGCRARETADFDPTGFPSDRVVELWEIETVQKPDQAQ
jgi:hypothetical protein